MAWTSDPGAVSSGGVLARSGSYFRLLFRWWWLFALAAVVAAGVAMVWSQRQPVTYTAKSRLLVGPGVDSMDPTLNDLRTSAQLMEVYAELATTRPVLQEVAKSLKLESVGQVSSGLGVKTNSETLILTVQAENKSGDRAVQVANAVAEHLVALSPSGPRGTETLVQTELRTQVKEVEALIADSKEQIRELQAERKLATDLARERLVLGELADERDRMNETQKTLANLLAAQTGNQTNRLQIVEPAVRASRQETPLRLNVMLAVMAALVLAALVVVAVEIVDDRIHGEQDLVDAGVAVLGSIQAGGGSSAEDFVVLSQPSSETAEHYRLLGSRLLANGDSGSQVVLVAGVAADRSQGGANVASNLGLVLAQAGQRVIVVDADLHDPQLGPRLDATKAPGLTGLLADDQLALDEASVVTAAGLRVLPAGTVTGNPFELLASARMVTVLTDLRSAADVVLVVTAPLMSFADGLVLARQAERVLVVAQDRRTRCGAVLEAMARLQELGMTQVGVVLIRTPARLGRLGLTRWRRASEPKAPSAAVGTSRSPIVADPAGVARARRGKATS